jgi:two-component system chemotaxis sensor kinase CheA
MDVVKSHIERIGGSVDLQSTLAQGTTLTIKIPLTLAIVPALMVGSGGQRFVIPQASLLEVITAGATAPIEKLHNIPVYRLRDRLVPLVWLSEILGIGEGGFSSSRSQTDGVPVAVLQVDGQRYGLVVDEVLNTHEIVVKPIGASIKAIGAYAAATILGDGSVAMILDVGGIARLGGLLSDSGERVAEQLESEQQAEMISKSPSQQGTLLVCEVGGGRQVAIPLGMVERLEELPVSQFEQTDSGIAASYRGTVLPIVLVGGPAFWDRLSTGDSSDASVHVVVHRRADKLIGAAVQRIVDVVPAEAVVDTASVEKPGGAVIGMTLARGRVLEVLDLGRI